jgi:hypothetical protein
MRLGVFKNLLIIKTSHQTGTEGNLVSNRFLSNRFHFPSGFSCREGEFFEYVKVLTMRWEKFSDFLNTFNSFRQKKALSSPEKGPSLIPVPLGVQILEPSDETGIWVIIAGWQPVL